ARFAPASAKLGRPRFVIGRTCQSSARLESGRGPAPRGGDDFTAQRERSRCRATRGAAAWHRPLPPKIPTGRRGGDFRSDRRFAEPLATASRHTRHAPPRRQTWPDRDRILRRRRSPAGANRARITSGGMMECWSIGVELPGEVVTPLLHCSITPCCFALMLPFPR